MNYNSHEELHDNALIFECWVIIYRINIYGIRNWHPLLCMLHGLQSTLLQREVRVQVRDTAYDRIRPSGDLVIVLWPGIHIRQRISPEDIYIFLNLDRAWTL